MNTRKDATEKVIAANPEDSRKSNKPKTGAGKSRAAVNSTELEWFTEELQISEADRPDSRRSAIAWRRNTWRPRSCGRSCAIS